MGRTFDAIDDQLGAWLAAQPMFFVATAPDAGGHVNVSPKGLDSFRVLGPAEVAYLDLTGSGVETIAHLRDNGRITFLFCAFSGPPRVVRLFGRGEAVRPADTGFTELADRFPPLPGVRSVIRVKLDRIANSCGFGVPEMELVGPRSQMEDWAVRKGPDGLAAYQADNNAVSIDGLPGLSA